MTQIKEHPEYYITDTGDVYSMINNAGNTRTEPYKLSQTLGRDGYYWVGLKGSNKRMKKVHRLVATTFLGNPDNKPVVNHKDGDKTNNCTKNLEWVTHQENTIHAHENGLVIVKHGEEHHSSKLTDEETKNLVQLTLDGYTNEEIAGIYGLHSRYVSLIRHKKRQKHIWDAYFPDVESVQSTKLDKNRDDTITEQVVKEALTTERSNADIGREFSVHPSAISRIRSGNKPSKYYLPYILKYKDL